MFSRLSLLALLVALAGTAHAENLLKSMRKQLLHPPAQQQQPQLQQPQAMEPQVVPGEFETKVNKFATIGEGALIGAGVGVVAAKLTGHNDGKSARVAAAIGAGLGAAVGAAVAHGQKKFASKEDQLNRMTDEATRQNADLDDIVNTTNSMLATDRSTVTRLKTWLASKVQADRDAGAALRTSQVTKMRKDLQLYDTVIKSSDQRLSESQASLAQYREKYKDQDVARVAMAVDEFETRSKAFKALREEDATLLASIDDGSVAR